MEGRPGGKSSPISHLPLLNIWAMLLCWSWCVLGNRKMGCLRKGLRTERKVRVVRFLYIYSLDLVLKES